MPGPGTAPPGPAPLGDRAGRARAGAPGRGAPAAHLGIAVGLACLAAAPAARAGGLDFDVVGARAIGRAGTTTVSGDGGAVLLVNPAGLARSTSLRLQLGAALHDDDARFHSADPTFGSGAPPPESGTPTVADRSSPLLAAGAALQGALGPVVLGVAVLELGHLERALPSPVAGQPPDEVIQLFPHRYGGMSLTYRRRALVAGAALRATDWLGVGLSVGGSDVELSERRRMWAGFADREPIGDPRFDLDVTLAARDRLVPFAAGGVLVAPPSLPLELAASLSWSADASLGGDVALDPTSSPEDISPEPRLAADHGAQLRIAMPTTLRAGARYLGDRFLVEIGGELIWFRGEAAAPSWRVSGASVEDQTGLLAGVDRVPSLAAQRDHAAVRGAVDVEAVSGLLWLTAGYAYSTSGTAESRVSPAFGDLAGHTVSLGAEGTWNQITFTLGVSRRLVRSVPVSSEASDVAILNPFFDPGPGDAAPKATAGRHGRGHDAVGLTVEVAWE